MNSIHTIHDLSSKEVLKMRMKNKSKSYNYIKSLVGYHEKNIINDQDI